MRQIRCEVAEHWFSCTLPLGRLSATAELNPGPQRIMPISLMKTSNDRSEIINKSLCSARTCDSTVSGYWCLEHSECGLLLLVRIWADSVCCGAPMFGSFWVNGIFFVLAGYRLGFKIAQECILYYTAMLIQQHG